MAPPGSKSVARRAKGLDFIWSRMRRKPLHGLATGNASTQPGIKSRRFSRVMTRESGCSPSGRSRPMYVTGSSGTGPPSHRSMTVVPRGHQVDQVPHRQLLALHEGAHHLGHRHLVLLDPVGRRDALQIQVQPLRAPPAVVLAPEHQRQRHPAHPAQLRLHPHRARLEGPALLLTVAQHEAEERLLDLLEALARVDVDLRNDEGAADPVQGQVDEFRGPVGRLGDIAGVLAPDRREGGVGEPGVGAVVGVEKQCRQVVVGPVLGLLPVHEEAQPFAVDRRDRPSRQHAEPGRGRPAAERQRHVEDVGVDQQPARRREPAAQLGVEGGDQPVAVGGRYGRPGVGGHPGAAPAVDEDAGLVALPLPVVEVLADREHDPAGDLGGDLAPRRPPPRPAPPGRRRCAAGGPGRGTACRERTQQLHRAEDVELVEQLLDPAVEGPRLLLAPRDGEHVGGVRPARVLVRVEALTEPLERLPVRVHIGELRGVRRDHGVEAREQRPAHRPRQRPEPGRLPQRHVAARQRAGQPQHIGDGVQEEVRADAEPGLVDDRPVLPDRDRLRLGAERAPLGERP